MNKRRWMLVSVVVGGLLLFGAAFANASNVSGYDIYKSALKNTRVATNITTQVKVSVTDNDKTVMNVDGTAKMDLKNSNMSSIINGNAGGQSYSMEMYHQDNKVITKNSNSEVYNVINRLPGYKHEPTNKNKEVFKQKYAQDVENVIDTVVGNIKNYVVLNNNSDGSKEVSLQLSGNQIPATANALASLAIKAGTQEGFRHEKSLSPLAADLKAQIPTLVSDITIGNVDIKAQIDSNNFIKSQQMKISITGKDADGVSHNVIVNANLNLSNINQTTPDTVDLTGKQVKTLQPEYGHRIND